MVELRCCENFFLFVLRKMHLKIPKAHEVVHVRYFTDSPLFLAAVVYKEYDGIKHIISAFKPEKS